MKNYVFHPGKIINVDAADSMLHWSSKCRCGNPGTRFPTLPARPLCEGCFFRYTVMKAAGRKKEFWEAHDALPESVDPGWVSYNVKYSVSVPPENTIRMRNIKADEAVS